MVNRSLSSPAAAATALLTCLSLANSMNMSWALLSEDATRPTTETTSLMSMSMAQGSKSEKYSLSMSMNNVMEVEPTRPALKLFPKSGKSGNKADKYSMSMDTQKSSKSGKLIKSKVTSKSEKIPPISMSPSSENVPAPTAPLTPAPKDGVPTVPTVAPSNFPVYAPTSAPTSSPTSAPTSSPTPEPTSTPTSSPTSSPTSNPTQTPSQSPILTPTTNNPTSSPSLNPAVEEILTSIPSFAPTNSTTNVTAAPTIVPTDTTHAPTMTPPCTCSPRSYTFKLVLSQNCTTDDIDGNPGIEGAFCNIDDWNGGVTGGGSGGGGGDISHGGVTDAIGGIDGNRDVNITMEDFHDSMGDWVQDLEQMAIKNNKDNGYGDGVVSGFGFNVLLSSGFWGSGSGGTTGAGVTSGGGTTDGNEVNADEKEVSAKEEKTKPGSEKEPTRRLKNDDKEQKQKLDEQADLPPEQDKQEAQVDAAADVKGTDDSEEEEIQELEQSRQVINNLIPAKIISIIFVEFDNSGLLNIIHINSTYAATDLTDGAIFTFPSVSNDNPMIVPGGLAMLFVGVDESGNKFTRSRVAWSYESGCDSDMQVLEVGDGIGWVEVVEFEEPRPCAEATEAPEEEEEVRRELRSKVPAFQNKDNGKSSKVPISKQSKEQSYDAQSLSMSSVDTGAGTLSPKSGKMGKSSGKSGKVQHSIMPKSEKLFQGKSRKEPVGLKNTSLTPVVTPTTPPITTISSNPFTTPIVDSILYIPTPPPSIGFVPIEEQPVEKDYACSCTPTSYTFQIALNQNCADNMSIQDGEGISAFYCIVDEIDADVDIIRSNFNDTNAFHRGLQLQNTDRFPVQIVRVVFVEINGGLETIHRDETYDVTDLQDGDLISYTSITDTLNPDLPLNEQTNKVPEGVALVLYGLDAQGEPVTNRVVWWYDVYGLCEESVKPIQVGDEIGWVNIADFTPANPDFC